MRNTPLLRELTPAERRQVDAAWGEYLAEAHKAYELGTATASNKELVKAFFDLRKAWNGYTKWLEKNHIATTLGGYRKRMVEGLHTRYRIQCLRIGVHFDPVYRKTEEAAFKYARKQLALPDSDIFQPFRVEICVSHREPARGCNPHWEQVTVLMKGD